MYDITLEEVEAAPRIPKSQQNCTIVSMLPYAIKEVKPNIIPGYFQIPASRNGLPSLLHIGSAIHWLDSPFPKQPPIKMTELSTQMARSVVNDFVEAQICLDSDAAPGIFWIEGHIELDEVLKKHADKIREAEERQKKWFLRLIREADDDWGKTKSNKSISDIQRYAGKFMNMDREWLNTSLESVMERCPLCKGLVEQGAVVHSICGYILRPNDYDKMKSRIVKEVVK